MRATEEEARKRRRRKIMRAIWKRYQYTLMLAIAVIAAVVIAAIVILAGGTGKEAEKVQENTTAAAEAKDIAIDPEEGGDAAMMDPDNFIEPFNRMSCDWGAGDTDGLTLYQIPEEYKRTGGKFPQVVQVYTYLSLIHI